MPDRLSDRLSLGEILILRSGLDAIASDLGNSSAKRKQARALMICLDELIERREKETR